MNDYAPMINRRNAHYALTESRQRALLFLASIGWTFAVGVLIGAVIGLSWGGV